MGALAVEEGGNWDCTSQAQDIIVALQQLTFLL